MPDGPSITRTLPAPDLAPSRRAEISAISCSRSSSSTPASTSLLRFGSFVSVPSAKVLGPTNDASGGFSGQGWTHERTAIAVRNRRVDGGGKVTSPDVKQAEIDGWSGVDG